MCLVWRGETLEELVESLRTEHKTVHLYIVILLVGLLWVQGGDSQYTCQDVDGLCFHGSGLLCNGFNVWKERSYFVSGNGSIGFVCMELIRMGYTFVP